jgi:hypothetical protein
MWGIFRDMRQKFLAAAAVIALATAARADDTKPPAISDVKASASKGKVTVEARITDETGVLSAICHHRTASGGVEDSPMAKNDFDDIFKVTFAGTGDTEYWIESSDLLGNGPATYGTQSKPYTASGKPAGKQTTTVAQKEPVPETKPAEPPAEHAAHHGSHHAKAAKEPTPPSIDHRKPGVQPAADQAFTLRMKIRSESALPITLLMYQAHGTAGFTTIKLNHGDGDNYDVAIPASAAHGQVDYFILAKNEAGLINKLGDGDPKTPFSVTFKAVVAAVAANAGPYTFTDNPPFRVLPNKAIVLRAQVVPTSGGDVPDHVAVLWRGNDAQDQMSDMQTDATGGWGGFRVELPGQDEGAIFYQIVACDAAGSKCGVDTGSKRKWHATTVASQPGGAQPMPLDAVSTKAPPSLPE